MSSIRHLAVSPKLPTTLADQTHVDLPGYDIWMCYINTLHVVPTELDVSRFEEALSRVLQLYPHVAGRYRHTDSRWFIELTNEAIPVVIDYKLESSFDSLLNDGWVIQDDLSPFIDTQPFGASIVNGSGPLLRVKLTFFNHETCIGLSWNHSLGDATVLFRFVHTLSQFYQGLSPEFATPSFKKYHFPTPSDFVVAEFWPHAPHLHEVCDIDAFTPSPEPFEHVTWRIDDRDIEDLHSALSENKKQKGASLSKQDCMTAYLVAALNYTRGNPVQTVKNIASYRHVKAPFITENAASNLILFIVATVPMDMAGIATAVRNSLVQCRDPDHVYNWVTLTSNATLEAANARKAFPFPVHDDTFIVNSLTAVDWCSAHFGYAEGTQFHMTGRCKNLAKLNRSNPVKGADGVWRRRESVDISIGVAPEVKAKLLETLGRGVRYMFKEQL